MKRRHLSLKCVLLQEHVLFIKEIRPGRALKVFSALTDAAEQLAGPRHLQPLLFTPPDHPTELRAAAPLCSKALILTQSILRSHEQHNCGAEKGPEVPSQMSLQPWAGKVQFCPNTSPLAHFHHLGLRPYRSCTTALFQCCKGHRLKSLQKDTQLPSSAPRA